MQRYQHSEEVGDPAALSLQRHRNIEDASWPDETPVCRFLRSDAAKEFVGFISALNDAVKGRSSTDECSMSQPVLALVDVLKQMREWVDEIPPQQQSLRYGNPAYRCEAWDYTGCLCGERVWYACKL